MIFYVRGVPFTIDDRDAAQARWKWQLHPYGYAFRSTTRAGRRLTLYLHREILGHGPGDPHVDHHDGDPTNNRRSNLRVATQAQNAQNTVRRGGSSRHRGVSWDRRRGKWFAQAQVAGRKVALGRFDEEEDAARAAAAFRAEHMPFAVEKR